MPLRTPLRLAILLTCMPLGSLAAQQPAAQQPAAQQPAAQQPAAQQPAAQQPAAQQPAAQQPAAQQQPQQSRQAQQAPAVVVTMNNEPRFIPAVVTIRAGQSVRWRNDSRMAHTVTADPDQARHPQDVSLPAGAEPFDSGQLQPQQIYTHTFEQPGQYVYFCQNHEPAKMVGTVVVEAAGQAPQRQ